MRILINVEKNSVIFVGYVRVFSAKEILDVLLNLSSYLDKIVDGSAEDELSNKFKNEINQVDEDRYQQALTSTRVKPIVNNAPIRIPAFIVPLEFDDEKKLFSFLWCRIIGLVFIYLRRRQIKLFS